MQVQYERNGQSYVGETDNMPPTTLAYLLQYGWAQSLQDSIAGREKKVRQEYVNHLNAKAREEMGDDDQLIAEYVTENFSEKDVRQLIEDDIHGTLLKRSDAILNGTIGQRGPSKPRKTLFDIVAEEMFDKWLDTQLRAKGSKRPAKTSDQYKGYVAKYFDVYVEKKRDDIQAEADKRAESDAVATDVELSL